MKFFILKKKNYNVCLKFYRHLTLDLWKEDFSRDISRRIETYWQDKLQYENLFDKKKLKNKMYVLSMFPYPSGNLHMGHVRVYTLSDTMARFYRMNGKNVFHPMGWDAFGLPAENAAIERGITPQMWTQQNIIQMKAQLQKLGCTFDWNYELQTCSPDYYRWTQFIFLKMYDAGLVYQKEAIVNWDPVDRTVLAEEQVDEEGRSWRSGAKIEKKILNQWFIRTTKFAKILRDGLNDESLLHWKDITAIQKNWIAECDGYSFDFRLENSPVASVNIWIKNPSSILKAGFVFVKPCSLIDVIANDGQCGMDRKLNITCINPFTGYSIPVFVQANASYPDGRDVYLGLPHECQTDAVFAKLNLVPDCSDCAWYSKESIIKLAQKLKFGGWPVNSKLKDWLISRQRYWGTPIPIVHCPRCGIVPVPYEKLPVVLPPLPNDISIKTSLNSFLKNSDWINTHCFQCLHEAKRETDTMDTFVDSSWYFLRYFDRFNNKKPFETKIANQLMPVDLYVGGLEHAVLHLYYARFMNYFLNSINMIDHKEPFRSLFVQGVVKSKTYKTFGGKYVKPEDIQVKNEKTIYKNTGEELIVTWEKMSKSKHNGVEPNDVIEKYGIDTTRLFLLFSIAPRSTRKWDDTLFSDVLKWQHRLWLTIKEFIKIRTTPLEGVPPWIDFKIEDKKLREARNCYIKGASYHYTATQQLASTVAELQGFTNILRKAPREVRKYSKEYERALAAFIIMLAPITPNFAATLWYGFTHAPGRLHDCLDEIRWNENVTKQQWPLLDSDYEVPIIYRVNARRNFNVKIPNPLIKTLTCDKAIEYGMTHPTVKKIFTSFTVQDVKLTRNEPYNALCYITVPEEEANSLDITLKAKKEKDII